MSDSFVRCQCAKIGDMINGDCSDTNVSGKPFAYLGCMRLAAHWTDSYPVAEFWFIWSDKLGLPEYPPVYITLNLMDQSKLSYFTSRYSALDRDELGDLVERRADLADEAVAALDQVLAQRGLSQTDLYTPPMPIPPKTAEQEKAEITKETKLAINLLRSWLATSCKFMVAMVCIAPAQQLLRAVGLGAIWSGLVVLVVGYVGYQVGHFIVKGICANGEVTFEQKRKKLWLLFAALWPIFGFIYGIALVVFQRS